MKEKTGLQGIFREAYPLKIHASCGTGDLCWSEKRILFIVYKKSKQVSVVKHQNVKKLLKKSSHPGQRSNARFIFSSGGDKSLLSN